MSQELKIEL